MKINYFLLTPKGYKLKQFDTKQTTLLDKAFEEVGYYNLDTFSPWLPAKYVIIYDDGECTDMDENKLASELTKCNEYGNAMVIKVNRKYQTRDSYQGVKNLNKKDIKQFKELFDTIIEVKKWNLKNYGNIC